MCHGLLFFRQEFAIKNNKWHNDVKCQLHTLVPVTHVGACITVNAFRIYNNLGWCSRVSFSHVQKVCYMHFATFNTFCVLFHNNFIFFCAYESIKISKWNDKSWRHPDWLCCNNHQFIHLFARSFLHSFIQGNSITVRVSVYHKWFLAGRWNSSDILSSSCPASAADWFTKGCAMHYYVYVVMHLKDP